MTPGVAGGLLPRPAAVCARGPSRLVSSGSMVAVAAVDLPQEVLAHVMLHMEFPNRLVASQVRATQPKPR